MSKELHQKIHDYIAATRWATLATVRDGTKPVLRAMGSFVPDNGLNVYYSTAKTADKVKDVEKNGWVNFFFQHEGQELQTFKNVALIGIAHEVKEGEEHKKAVDLLSARNPRFKARVEKGELKDIGIFKIEPKEIKYLDYAKGFGKAGIEVLTF